MSDFSYTTPGTASFTAPTSGTALVQCIGSGGGGGAGAGLSTGGGGGGGGGYASKIINLVAGHVYTVIVPTGGTGGVWSAGVGNNGAAAIFKDGSTVLVSGPGGSGGSASGGAGGNASNAIGTSKYNGGNGNGPGGYDGGDGGQGGGALGGVGGFGGHTVSNNPPQGLAGTAPGGGGGGGYQSSGGNGGNGANGTVVIDYVSAETDPGHYLQKFDLPGISSWIAPAAGKVIIQCLAGGGGGRGGQALGYGGAGGGGGAYASSIITVAKGDSLDITVGAAGTGAPYNSASATDGGDSFVKRGGTTLVLAKGGTHATGTTSGAGVGGSAAGCIGTTINAGYSGVPSITTSQNGGAGGNGALPLGGVGGAGGTNATPAAANGAVPGAAGGGGSAVSGGSGGSGAKGVVQIAYYMTFGSVIVDSIKKPIVRISQIQSGIRKSLVPYVIRSDVKDLLSRLTPDLAVTARPLPDYIPAGLESLYNVETGTLNWTATTMPKLTAALGTANTQPLHIVVIGDSVSEGWTYLNNLPPYNFTSDRPHAWPLMMRDTINELLGLPVGGTGFVRSHSIAGNYFDERWSGFSNWDASKVHYVTTSNGNTTFVSDKAGTGVAIVTMGGGAIKVTIDNGSPVTVLTSTTGLPHRTEFTGLTGTTHTVKIETPVSGTQISLLGIEIFNPTAGIRIHNVAQGGATAVGTGQAAWGDFTSPTDNMVPVYKQYAGTWGTRPQLVMILLGGNDLHGGATPAQVANSIEAIGLQFDNVDTDIMIAGPAHGSALFGVSLADIHTTLGLVMQKAVDNGWAMLDTEFITGGYEALAGLGYTGDYYGHLNVDGAKFLGRAVAKAVMQTL